MKPTELGETAELPVEDVVAAVDPLAPGQRIGRFVIRARLGEGGMGIVVAAHDPELDRLVAVKVVRDDRHPRHGERLRREARALARIEHPNVVRVYEVGGERGRLFLAMELVDGETLTAWLAAQRRTWREIVAMFARIADGLAAVHRGGIVHRDFKPDNVLVERAGTPRVVDFGLARLEATGTAPEPVALTRTGVRMGTPGYMAPEQIIGGAVDARADQYSFCVALGEAVFGREGHEREDTAPRRGPAALRALVERGLASDPAARFASMDALAAALRRTTSRARPIAIALGLVALAAGGITAAAVLSSHGAPAAPPAASASALPSSATTTTAPPSVQPSSASTAAAAPPVQPASTSTTAAPPSLQPTRSASATTAPSTTMSSTAVPSTAVPSAAVPSTAVPSAAVPSTTARSTTVSSTTAPSAAAKFAKQRRHPDAVREATRELGYGAVWFTGDADDDVRDVQAQADAARTELERGRLLYAVAAAERRRGNCDAAVAAAKRAISVLVSATSGRMMSEASRTDGLRFIPRARLVMGLCALEHGRVEDARAILDAPTAIFLSGVEGAERQLAIGIAEAELGDLDEALMRFHIVLNSGDAVGRALGPRLQAYARAAGISDVKR